MKRILALVLALMLALSVGLTAFAEDIDISGLSRSELLALMGRIEERLAEISGKGDKSETKEETKEETVAEPEYPELKKGSKGDDVKKLQQRLKDLNYLSGSADGDYGNGTASAVSAFQQEAGLEVTGVADAETQEVLFSDDAPKSKVYQKLDYKAVSRDPSAHEGDLITFQGRIVQVSESGRTVVFRIASKGRYDDVVYCTYRIPDNYSRFLEEDKVTVYGTCTGVYTYTTIMGASVTIPSCTIDRIELRK